MKIVVIKCGGSILDELTDEFFHSLRELLANEYIPVIVHGGGPAISTMMKAFSVPAEFKDGLRVTCEKTMEIVEMVLSGQANRQLCNMLSRQGFKVLGINGSDGSFLKGKYLDKQNLGYVGSISEVNTEVIEMAVEKGFIPVITPIAEAEDGYKLNINGDYAAASVAQALQADRCAFVTDVEGIIINGKIVEELSEREIDSYIAEGAINGGMVPKVKSALAAMAAGVDKVTIISGKKQFYKNNSWQGTSIAAEERILR